MEALKADIQMLQVAHDLKSPLTALEIIAARVKSLPQDERQLILQSIGRIQEIVREVLRPGQDESGFPDWGIGDLRALMDEKRLQFPNIQLQVEIIAQGPNPLTVPAASLNRALSNLINNACEANGEKGEVIIRVFMGHGLRFEIEDQGPGVPQEFRGRLGQLGLSGKSSTKARRGIGLYSAFQLANTLGGHLHIEPRIGRTGTHVCLDLTGTAKNRLKNIDNID
jgi:signal transduction histidine kinase